MKLEWVTCTAEDAWSSLAGCRKSDYQDLVGRTQGMNTKLKGWHHLLASLCEILHITRSLKKCIAWRFDKLIAKFNKVGFFEAHGLLTCRIPSCFCSSCSNFRVDLLERVI